MKKIIFPILALLLIAGSSCQEKIDIEKEKEAIMAVIEEETNAFIDRDWDRMAATYIQDSTNIRLGASKSSYGYYVGWGEINSLFEEYFKSNPEPSTNKSVNTNYRIKVYKESAWAIYDEAWQDSESEVYSKNISVRFLEKFDGEWKIVYLGLVSTSSYEEDEEGEVESETEE